MAECSCQWSYDRSAVMPCPTCRADLELGRMVRAMKEGYSLTRYKALWDVSDVLVRKNNISHGDTPEEALKGAK